MINFVHYFDSNEWSVSGEGYEFSLMFLYSESTTLNFKRLSFGWDVTVNGVNASSFVEPPANGSIVSFESGIVFAGQINALPGDEITVSAWVKHFNAEKNECSISFVGPEYKVNEWTPPIPYPDDGLEYEWDETAEQWATVGTIGEQE